jgi:hypothetical protein
MIDADEHTYFQCWIDGAWEKMKGTIPFDSSKPIIVAIFDKHLALQHFVVLHGSAPDTAMDVITRKAETVKWTNRRIPDAIKAAIEKHVTLLGGWLPAGKGTDFHGASPICFKLSEDDYSYIVVVSGQDHLYVDQPFADAIAMEAYDTVSAVQIP